MATLLLVGLTVSSSCSRTEAPTPAPSAWAPVASTSAPKPVPLLRLSAAAVPTGVPATRGAWAEPKRLWRYEPVPATKKPLLHSSGLIITGTKTSAGAQVLALDQATGRERWKQPVAATNLALAGDRVLAFLPDFELVGLDALTGEERFRLADVCEPLRVLSSQSIAVINCFRGGSGLVGIDVKTGRRAWSLDEPGTQGGWWELGIAVVGDAVYAAQTVGDWTTEPGGLVRRVDGKTGRTLWNTDVAYVGCVVRANEAVAVTVAEQIRGYRATDGKLLWAYQLPKTDAKRGYARWRDATAIADDQLVLPHADRILFIDLQSGKVRRQLVLPELSVKTRQVTHVQWDDGRLLLWIGDHVAGHTGAIVRWDEAAGWQVTRGTSEATATNSIFRHDRVLLVELGEKHWGLSAYSLPASPR